MRYEKSLEVPNNRNWREETLFAFNKLARHLIAEMVYVIQDRGVSSLVYFPLLKTV